MDKPKNPKLSPGPKLDNAPNEIKPIASKAGVLGTPKPMNDNVLQDDKVSVIPGQTQTDGKTGVVDVQDKKLGAHALQTPGKDTTIADVQLGDGKPKDKVDCKLQIPSGTPVLRQQGGSGNTPVLGSQNGNVGPSDQHGNIVGELLEKPYQGGKGSVLNPQPIVKVRRLHMNQDQH